MNVATANPVARRCRFCKCTEEYPCRLEDGEHCVLPCGLDVCTNPRCLVERELLGKRLTLQDKLERKALVLATGKGRTKADVDAARKRANRLGRIRQERRRA